MKTPQKRTRSLPKVDGPRPRAVNPGDPGDRRRVLSAHRALEASADGNGERVAANPAPHRDLDSWLLGASNGIGSMVEERRGANLEVIAAVTGHRVPARLEGELRGEHKRELEPWVILTQIFGENSELGGRALAACLRSFEQAHAGAEEVAAPVLLASVSSPSVHDALRDVLGFEVLRDFLRLEADVALVLGDADPALDTTRAAASGELIATLSERTLRSRAAVLLPRQSAGDRNQACTSPAAVRATHSVLVHRDGFPVAWASLRQTDSGMIFEDWLAAPEDPVALRALVRAAAEIAAEQGLTRLVTTCADTQPEWTLFQVLGFRVRPVRSYLLARTWRRPFDPNWLYEHLAYTPADLHMVTDVAGFEL